LIKTCQQARGEHEHLVKTQNKLNEELISIIDWFKRLIYELTQSIDLNLSLNNVNDVQDSLAVSLAFFSRLNFIFKYEYYLAT
jgi:hypothetical protein